MLWYPGRAPFCSSELLPLFKTYIDTLHILCATRHTDAVTKLNMVHCDILDLIETESQECNGTDRILNELRKFFDTSEDAINLAFRNKKYDTILETSIALNVIHDELAETLAKQEA